MGINITYPGADLYWGAMDGTLSGDQAYQFWLEYGYWPNTATQQAGEAYMQSIGIDPMNYQASLSGGNTVTINGINYQTVQDPMGNFVGMNTLDQYGNVKSQPQTDWYAEAAAGNPVIGGSVLPGMTRDQYNASRGSPRYDFTGRNYQNLQQATTSVPTQPGPQPQVLPPAVQNNPSYQVGSGNTNLGSVTAGAGGGSSAPTNVYGGGTIGNFWDNGTQQNNPLGGTQDTGLARWFRDTYGTDFNMSPY